MEIVDGSSLYQRPGCNLSDPKYGYDFVISTTQASINSDLCLYLHNNTLPCVEPKDLPPILELGDLAGFATFNILCSDFHVVENELGTPASPNAKKQRLLKRLQNISSTSFSLQQLFLDMDNATVQNVPVIVGMKPGSRAHLVVSGQLGNIWTEFTKKCHCPPISVVAVPQISSDPSKLYLKSFDRQVNRVKDSNGNAVKNPTKEQLAATTLDYRCMASGTQPLPAKQFSWTWVEPISINTESGVVAIKRQVFSQYLLDVILPQAKKSCITTDPVVGHRSFENGKLWADCVGDDICVINYTSADDPDTSSTRGSALGSEHYRLDVTPYYQCRVSRVGNTLTIGQELAAKVKFKCCGVILPMLDISFHDECTPFWAVSVDDYELSVGQTGCPQISHTRNSPDHSYNGFKDNDSFLQTKELWDKIRSAFTAPAPIDFTSINAAALQNFIFPGGKIPAAKAEDDVQSAPVAILALASTTLASLTFTTEIMQNYVPGEIANPSGKFEALQTQDGHSILFSLSSANVFQAIVEQSGASSTGWRIVDLSSSALSSAFASDKSAVAKTFDANQSAVDGTISLAMVVTSGGTDHLLLSLYNHNSTARGMDSRAHSVMEIVSVRCCITILYCDRHSSNAFGSGPPAPRTLSLPGNVTASAIAAARAYNNSTDLYAVGGQTLFWFPANSQVGQSVATTIFSNSIFQGTTRLSAMTHGGVTTIWGKNGSDQIYYSSCPNTQLGIAASWSTPLPLMNGIENMSAFANRTGYSNTIFASGGTSLWRQWHSTRTLPPSNLQTTRRCLQGDISVSVTAPCGTPVYINGLYYVLSSTPITVSSDKTGTLTVVENTHNTLNGTSITVTCGGHPTVIDPSHEHFQKITSLNTPTALSAAKIPKNMSFGSICDTCEDVGHAIEALPGEIFHAIKSAGEAIVHIVKEAASDVWHFVTTIAGKVYHAILSTVDAVVGAVEWVFNAIKTVIQDVIRFLELLLDWEDITRTKNVIGNIAKQFMQVQIDKIA
ncbi:hypothetical protein FAGAP_4871 [Fusarium agapanthi]|uniref:Uncharacterized protein n=1 Tax=Fusarium agapanthi TaxID=1803897 RepID=A0A9P5BCL0_9HYPO|nr:hypothetical protein FAGAP_4871 [Fusarium agapanthi]